MYAARAKALDKEARKPAAEAAGPASGPNRRSRERPSSKRPEPRPAAAGLLDPVAAQVETTLFRALGGAARAWSRPTRWCSTPPRWRRVRAPVAGWAVVGVIVVWTAASPPGPTTRRVGAACRCWSPTSPSRPRTLLSTPYVQSDAMLARHASTMPSLLGDGRRARLGRDCAAGRAASAPRSLMSLLDLSVRTEPDRHDLAATSSCCCSAAGVVGYSTGLVREAGRGAGRGRADRRRAGRAGPAGPRGPRRGAAGARPGAAARRGARRGGRRARSAGRGAGGRAAGAGAGRAPRPGRHVAPPGRASTSSRR